jgi:hypothetical protein
LSLLRHAKSLFCCLILYLDERVIHCRQRIPFIIGYLRLPHKREYLRLPTG